MKSFSVTSLLCVTLLFIIDGSLTTEFGPEPVNSFDFFEHPIKGNLKRVKRSESTKPSTGSSARAYEPRSFTKQNSPPLPHYPPRGSGRLILPRRYRGQLPVPPQKIRLRSSKPDTNPNEGRIEILKGKKWGLVCDDEWSQTAADVACKELGFRRGCRSTKSNSFFGVEFGTKNRDVLFGKVRCTGKEKTIFDCNHKKPKCKKSQTAGVVCYYNDGCPYGWTSFNGVCYRLEYAEKTFDEAVAYCKTKKANLIYFFSDMENNFIGNMLKLRFPNITAAWTSGNWMEERQADGRLYGAWVWSGPNDMVSSEKNHAWFPGFDKYTKRPQQSYRHRSCIAISSIFLNMDKRAVDTNYFWWDNISCKQKLPFICERANFKWRGRS